MNLFWCGSGNEIENWNGGFSLYSPDFAERLSFIFLIRITLFTLISWYMNDEPVSENGGFSFFINVFLFLGKKTALIRY